MQIKSAGLDPRHIQQIIHQPGGVQYVLAYLIGLRRVLRPFAGKIEGQDLRLAEQHRQRGA